MGVLSLLSLEISKESLFCIHHVVMGLAQCFDGFSADGAFESALLVWVWLSVMHSQQRQQESDQKVSAGVECLIYRTVKMVSQQYLQNEVN